MTTILVPKLGPPNKKNPSSAPMRKCLIGDKNIKGGCLIGDKNIKGKKKRDIKRSGCFHVELLGVACFCLLSNQF